MNDRVQIQNSFEVTQKKYVGTGNSDITKWEWQTNLQRDLIASNISDSSRLMYMSVALNEHPLKTKLRMMNRMVQPVGPPPKELIDEKMKVDREL